MASIKIKNNHENLIFAAAVANSTGANFEEQGEWIIIEDTPELTIPRYEFDDAIDFKADRDSDEIELAWRSLLLNRKGFLRFFDDHEIVLVDDPPKNGQSNFLLRFPTAAEKRQSEEWAERAGYDTLTSYILAAIDEFNKNWKGRSG
jgi:hypothetical protein